MPRHARLLVCVVAALGLVGAESGPARAQILGNVVVTGSQLGQTVRPGVADVVVFVVQIRNNATLGAARLTSLSFQNTTTGTGTIAQRDQDWSRLSLRVSPSTTVVDTATFTNGVATFSHVDISVPALGGTATLVISGAASLTARDGDALDLTIPNATAVTITGGATGTFPIDPAGNFPVDGMVVKQVGITHIDTPTFNVGTKFNLALNVVLPANGYQPDELKVFTVLNLGSARPVSGGKGEITRMELYQDDGDGIFEPNGANGDRDVKEMTFISDRWQASGMSLAVPVGGTRLFVSLQISDVAEGRTVKLALPPPPDIAVTMLSADDGLLDAGLVNRSTTTIAIVDRVTLAGGTIAPGTTPPGRVGAPMLDLIATNKYTIDKTLTGLTITNGSVGPGAQADLDAETELLTLYEDTNDDHILGTGDLVLGTAFYVGGLAKFGGFTWKIPAGATRHLLLTGNVSLTQASDGDVLGSFVAQAADLEFADPTALSAAFPIGSGTAWTVDGMVAAQIDDRGAPAKTLGPNDGPALALDVVVPPHGYQDDVLQSVAVTNVGSAPDSNLAEVRLWRDGGDGQFDAGTADDQNLGVLAPWGGQWSIGGLSQPLGRGGARLFVAVTTADTVIDSATIQLELPVGGLEVQSGNDGPIDVPVVNPEFLTLTDRALAATLSAVPDAVVVSQLVTVQMAVANRSSEDVNGVTPSAPTIAGSAGLAYQSGPVPPSASIAPGGSQVFTWTYRATTPGNARFTATASGVGAVSGQTRTTLPATSNEVNVFAQPGSLPFTSQTAMPITINRGQTNVVPLYFTLSSPSEPPGPRVRITRVRFRIEAQGGAGIVPADLLSRVALFAGTSTYIERTALETSGAEVDLVLATPILVTRGDPLTTALAIDVDSTTIIPNFRIVVPDSTYFTAEDAATGAPVNLRLTSPTYPIRTGLARVVDQATELDVAAVATGAAHVGPSQLDAGIMTARLTNPGITGVTSDVRVSSFAVILRDAAGAAVFAPGNVLTRVRVRSGPQLIADEPIAASADSVMDLTLSPLLSVPVNSPLDIRLTGDFAATAPLGAYRLSLAPTAFFDARDPNSNDPVTVVYATNPVAGDSILVEARAESLAVLGIPQLPSTVGVGAASVVAMHAVLRHPGSAGTARVRVDTLAVRCVDEARNPLVPALYIDRMHVLWNGVEITSLDATPASGNTMRVALPGRLIAPGDRDTVTIVLDFEATTPTTTFELTLNASGIVAGDANTGFPVTIVPEDGTDFPLFSGLTHLSAPARTLVAGLADHMPAAIVTDGAEVTAGDVTLRNEASPGSGSIQLDHQSVRASEPGGGAIAIGAAVERVRLYHSGTLWAEAAVAPGDTLATVSGAQLTIAAGTTETLELRFVPRSSPAVQAFRLGFAAADVGVIQPGSPLLQVAVLAPSGQGFPQWSQAAGFTIASLEGSYANFPNPFAAGRQPTTFAYYLPSPGRVSLRIFTSRGERVVTIVQDATRGAGLQQMDVWNGRNGHGDVVTNGVYVAELVVKLDNGGNHRLLRKVAVVR